ncbi:MAG: hypothetical protein AAGF66_09180 [Cyanobacteria bacterium P01_H01_bin.119]
MTASPLMQNPAAPSSVNANQAKTVDEHGDKILCSHCNRTANNGLKCIGRCVADDDY